MNLRRVLVNVEWKDAKAIQPPDGLKYITVAKFQDDNNWPNEAWSIVLKFDISPKVQGNSSKAYAHFLVNTVPQEKLLSRNKFQLYEGKNLVADVYI